MNAGPTIRELAALAGVSRSTISLALRNHPSIPPATRDRIHELARRNGYHHNPLVATLMAQLRLSGKRRATETLAYLTNWDSEWGWKKHPNEPNFFAGASRRAAELGYEIEHFWALEPGMTQSRLSRILYARGIRGVIIAPLLRARGHLSLEWKHFAAATISTTVYKPDIHRCSHLHYNGMVTALRSLKHRGYCRIGLAILAAHDMRVNHGWQAAFVFNNYNIPASRRIPPYLAADWKKDGFRKWLEKYSPEIVLSNADNPFFLLRDLGYRVPQDIGYANLDVQPGTPYSGIDQLAHEVGAGAVDLVAIQLQNNEMGLPNHARAVHIQGEWVDGETTTLLKTASPSIVSATTRRAVSRAKRKAGARTASLKK